MIFEVSWDTEYWSNGCWLFYMSQYIKIEKVFQIVMLHLLFCGIFDQINAALVSMWNWPQIYHMVIFGHCRLIKTTF